MISKHLRLDKGAETGDMATIHAFIAQIHDDNDEAADTVHYGPSTIFLHPRKNVVQLS